MNRKPRLEQLAERKTTHPITTHPTSKPPFLMEHTHRIEQKLSHLKQKISQQKKGQTISKNNAPVQEQLMLFLQRIGMQQYFMVLLENGIDTIETLRDAKQSELEEIGIAKGHSLKIVMTIRKVEGASTKEKGAIMKGGRAVRQTSSDSPTKAVKKKTITEVYDIQTDSIPIQHKKMAFCLTCYKRSQFNFCSPSCEIQYSCMFEKYENNLHTVQETFLGKKKVEGKPDDEKEGCESYEKEGGDFDEEKEDLLNNFDFLWVDSENELDEQQYQLIKQIIDS